MSQGDKLEERNGQSRTTVSSSMAAAATTRDLQTDVSSRERTRRLRICIVSSEFLGPFRNGGIGTAYTRLGQILNEAGYDVTLLYTSGRYTLTEPVEHWVDVYDRAGIRFVPLPEAPFSVTYFTFSAEASNRVFLWLRDHDDFDIVHFQECGGVGYHALLAQHQGLILQQATTIVGLHSSSHWVRSANGEISWSETDLENDFMERRSAELADVVWSPGHYMLDWVRRHGWDIRQRTRVQPLVVPVTCGLSNHENSRRRGSFNEIVFFGRQEVRKGLLIFLDALDRLVETAESGHLDDIIVTFLGKPWLVDGVNSERLIRERSGHWPFVIRLLCDYDHARAMEYLQGDGRLVVIPSVIENYPNVVLECLALQVPFLASRVGSIPEQVHPDDIERVCFEPASGELAERLSRAFREGHAPARLAFDPEQNNREWIDWHKRLGNVPRVPAESDSNAGARHETASYTISVCLTSNAAPHFLRQVLDSMIAQVQAPLEVIVVDAGSPGRVQLELNAIALDYDFNGRGWRWLRLDDGNQAAARNHAAKMARGEYVMFMSEHDVAKPHQIATFTSVMRTTGADILSSFVDDFDGDDAPGDHTVPVSRRLSTESNLSLSVLYDTIGIANVVLRRRVFNEVGGYPHEQQTGSAGAELFCRLMLKGYRVEVIPDALCWSRAVPANAIRRASEKHALIRLLDIHLAQVPQCYRPLVEICLGRSLTDRGVRSYNRFYQNLLVGPHEAAGLPLRYKVADYINLQIKRFAPLHRAGKATVGFVLRQRRRLLDRWFPTPGAGADIGLALRNDGPHNGQSRSRVSDSSGNSRHLHRKGQVVSARTGR